MCRQLERYREGIASSITTRDRETMHRDDVEVGAIMRLQAISSDDFPRCYILSLLYICIWQQLCWHYNMHTLIQSGTYYITKMRPFAPQLIIRHNAVFQSTSRVRNKFTHSLLSFIIMCIQSRFVLVVFQLHQTNGDIVSNGVCVCLLYAEYDNIMLAQASDR